MSGTSAIYAQLTRSVGLFLISDAIFHLARGYAQEDLEPCARPRIPFDQAYADLVILLREWSTIWQMRPEGIPEGFYHEIAALLPPGDQDAYLHVMSMGQQITARLPEYTTVMVDALSVLRQCGRQVTAAASAYVGPDDYLADGRILLNETDEDAANACQAGLDRILEALCAPPAGALASEPTLVVFEQKLVIDPSQHELLARYCTQLHTYLRDQINLTEYHGVIAGAVWDPDSQTALLLGMIVTPDGKAWPAIYPMRIFDVIQQPFEGSMWYSLLVACLGLQPTAPTKIRKRRAMTRRIMADSQGRPPRLVQAWRQLDYTAGSLPLRLPPPPAPPAAPTPSVVGSAGRPASSETSRTPLSYRYERIPHQRLLVMRGMDEPTEAQRRRLGGTAANGNEWQIFTSPDAIPSELGADLRKRGHDPLQDGEWLAVLVVPVRKATVGDPSLPLKRAIRRISSCS